MSHDDDSSVPVYDWAVTTEEQLNLPSWLIPLPPPSGRWMEAAFTYRIRIFHPALRFNNPDGNLSWREISKLLQTEFYPAVQFSELTRTSDINATCPEIYDASPARGQLPSDIFSLLMQCVSDPTSDLTGLSWTGFAEVNTEMPSDVTLIPGPVVPNRDFYCPCTGQTSPSSGIRAGLPTPNFVWPQNCRWLLTTGYDDLFSIFATNDIGLNNAVLSIGDIEALPAPKRGDVRRS